MNETERMFNDDVREKKQIARNAHRKPKKNGCRMFTDGKSEAQINRLDGPVKAYKLNEPMDWRTFKSLPEDIQRLYLTGLIDRYAARDTMLAEMFGVTHSAVSAHRGKLGVNGFGQGGNPKPECRLRWNEFLRKGQPAETRTEDTPKPETFTEGPEELQAEHKQLIAKEEARQRRLAEPSWDNLFCLAKELGKQYGVTVRIEVGVQ